MLCSSAACLSYAAGPERWHCDLALAALLLNVQQLKVVGAIPMFLEGNPVRDGHCLESYEALVPAICQVLPSAHVGLRSSQVGPLCLLVGRAAFIRCVACRCSVATSSAAAG